MHGGWNPVGKLSHIFPIRADHALYYESTQQRILMNGWKNWETWNVALWIQNDESLYNLALECCGFTEFKNVVQNDCGFLTTSDGVAWGDADYCEIQSMFNEMKATTDLQYWG